MVAEKTAAFIGKQSMYSKAGGGRKVRLVSHCSDYEIILLVQVLE